VTILSLLQKVTFILFSYNVIMRIMIRVFYFFLLCLAIVAFYISIAYLFSLFPTSHASGKKEHTIYLYKNSDFISHTEIIIKVSLFKDGIFQVFPNLLRNNHKGYLAFSYGDRDFMMDKKGFDDLNISLALKALFTDTPALIKVGHYGNIKKEECKVLRLSTKTLDKLENSILNSFKIEEGKVMRFDDLYKRYYVYYYKAKEDYNLFHTCNSWSGDRLRDAGIKMGYWTPFAQNVTSQFN